jgi:hypothetical protein
MTCILRWIICFAWIFPGALSAQEYSYTHYDVADGLASSTVYCIAQDKDGFIWVGTEAGVCRFDGNHFVSFTSADGLPDAEVLQLFGDSKGRVWMAPFRGSICYYYRGKFHNPGNDPVLAAIRLRQNVENFAEDSSGNILVQENRALHLVQPDGRVRNFDSVEGKPIDSSSGCARSKDGHFTVQIASNLFELTDTGFKWLEGINFFYDHPNYLALSPSWAVWRDLSTRSVIHSLVNGQVIRLPLHIGGNLDYSIVTYSIIGDSMLYMNQISGTLVYGLYQAAEQQLLLPGRKVSRTFGDRAGNLWFTTLGSGIYRLNSADFRTIHLAEPGFGEPSITFIGPNLKGDELLLGDNRNSITRLSLPNLRVTDSHPFNTYGANSILFAWQVSPNRYLYGTDGLVFIEKARDWQVDKKRQGIKAACMVDEHRVLIGGAWGSGILDIRSLRLTRQLWNSRISTVYCKNDTNYIGTLNGLWMLEGMKPPQYLGRTVAFLRNRIAAVTESDDGVLWVASNDAGVIGYRNGRVVAEITKKQGLVGNVCHCIYLYHGILWVGTDKGLNKVQLNGPGYQISFFNSNDGLASDVVNVVYAAGSRIYVGTTAGLTYFDESGATGGDECRLVLNGIMISGRNRLPDSTGLLLPVKQNNIRFEFVAISYRSVGKITYRYRLNGLDTEWRETEDNYLAYPSLPSGRYEFQLQAVNRFGTMSGLRSVSFEVATPFWKQVWFQLLMLVLFLSATWAFIVWRIGRVRKQQEQKVRQRRRMAELEHIALQSQMNPHFIFNCLSSIQQFVFKEDQITTNEYITGFARLIRATLNHSSQALIPVAEEVAYLNDYLSLEKMRFKSKMDYRIQVEPGMDIQNTQVPPMLIQPFVENSVRHGLRHKKSGQGIIRIQFREEDDHLVVIIQDNGIGRKKAMEYKTGEHIEYQSKGMSLTAARIEMIKVLYKSEIRVEVEDLTGSDGEPVGTRILIRFPVFRGGLGQA